jgi:hypothetical protein
VHVPSSGFETFDVIPGEPLACFLCLEFEIWMSLCDLSKFPVNGFIFKLNHMPRDLINFASLQESTRPAEKSEHFSSHLNGINKFKLIYWYTQCCKKLSR